MEPALGFLPRPGTRQYESSCSIKPRPSRNGSLGFIRQSTTSVGYNRYDNSVTGDNESWILTVTPADVRFDTGDRLVFNFKPQSETLVTPFPISGVVIPPGSYEFSRFRFQGETSAHRPIQLLGFTEIGDYFTGTLLQTSATLNWTSPEGTIQTSVKGEQNFGKLPQGNFVQRLWQLNFAYAFNPDLIFTSFVQYDNQSLSLSHNSRVRWTINPGNDLFIVWNRGWRRLITRPSDLTLIPDTDVVAVKLRWTFRM
jgi:hypothetical protein